MQGRALAIVVLCVVVTFIILQTNLARSSKKFSKNVISYVARQSAQNIAQSGVYMGLRKLKVNIGWREGFSNLTVMGGKVTVRIVDTTFNGQNVIGILSSGTAAYGAFGDTLDKIVDTTAYSKAYLPKGYIPASVKAAITTNNPVQTLGTLTVDGRDHDLSGTVIANHGTLGIWTTSTYSQSGSSKTGGTSSAGVDYAPAKPANVQTIKTSAVWPATDVPGSYPLSPDSVMGGPAKGFPEGTLESIAKSGVNGSQYTTNPSTLTYPLKGVTYVELAKGGTWNSANIDGEGILVVHNDWKNAILKNWNSGTFRGLVIVDDPVHIHTTVIGAIIGLTPTPSEGNCIGNGSGDVYFSSEAITNATSSVNSSSNSGSCDAKVITWWE